MPDPRGSAAAKVEYRAVCSDGSDVTARVYSSLGDAARAIAAMDTNKTCSPHRVQRRTVTYGEWSDA